MSLRFQLERMGHANRADPQGLAFFRFILNRMITQAAKGDSSLILNLTILEPETFIAYTKQVLHKEGIKVELCENSDGVKQLFIKW